MRRLTALLALAIAGCGGASGSSPSSSDNPTPKRAKTAPLRDAGSHFSIQAPAGCELKVHQGVYVLTRGEASMSFSRSATAATPEDYGNALVEQLGGDVHLRRASPREFNAEVDDGQVRDSIVVVAAADGLYAMTARSPLDHPLPITTVQLVGASAKGGVTLTPPKAPAARIALEPYRAPDGGATGLVPAGPGWTINSSQGSIEGSGEKGSFLFGRDFDVVLPETAPAGAENYNTLIAPYLGPGDAVATLFPKLAPQLADFHITSVVQEGVIPSFTQSAMLQFEYTSSGRPWVGAAMVATDDPSKYGNFQWKLYYSGIGVPQGSDPAVGAGLLKAWQSWDASGAIAQRTEQSKRLLDDTNQIWKDESEFRARQADRQSRDVGCLLQGYYEFEDNSRKYDLPPLDCDQQYVP
ncbi:MAG: hypothetical protein QOI80_1175 [Solirubrobacteraceae bacterium]|nr:hypothetical protein [Solirubrobacteraceae bacterium]